MRRWAISGSPTEAAPTRKRLTRGGEFESYPTFSRDGRSIAYVVWDDDKAGRIKLVGVGGGEGRVITPEPGHYVEPAFSPDGSLIAYRKTTDGFLTTPLYSRDPGIYVVPVKGGAPKRVAKTGTQPMFGATSDRIFFTATGEEEAAAEVGLDPGRRGSHPPHLSKCVTLRPVARRAVHRLDGAIPGLCHAIRPFRPIDRDRARRQGPAPVAPQRGCRRLDPLVGQQPHALLEPGSQPLWPEPCRGRRFRRGQAGRRPAARRTRRRHRTGEAQRKHRADRRADRHHARRRSDRKRYDPCRW